MANDFEANAIANLHESNWQIPQIYSPPQISIKWNTKMREHYSKQPSKKLQHKLRTVTDDSSATPVKSAAPNPLHHPYKFGACPF